jgi:hypothetical protein
VGEPGSSLGRNYCYYYSVEEDIIYIVKNTTNSCGICKPPQEAQQAMVEREV